MATNSERILHLEAQVITLSEEVNDMKKKMANPPHLRKTTGAIGLICEILVGLIEATRSINTKHDLLQDLAKKLDPYMPKKSG